MTKTMNIFKFSDQEKSVKGKRISLLFSINLRIHVKMCPSSLFICIIVIVFEVFLNGWTKI